jgi:hypothetical protein
MKKLLLAAATVGLCACNFPAETKMESVGDKQMETQKKPAPANGEAATSESGAAGQSSTATR